MSVCSAERKVLLERPKSRVSTKSSTYAFDVNGSGPSGRKLAGLLNVNGWIWPTLAPAAGYCSLHPAQTHLPAADWSCTYRAPHSSCHHWHEAPGERPRPPHRPSFRRFLLGRQGWRPYMSCRRCQDWNLRGVHARPGCPIRCRRSRGANIGARGRRNRSGKRLVAALDCDDCIVDRELNRCAKHELNRREFWRRIDEGVNDGCPVRYHVLPVERAPHQRRYAVMVAIRVTFFMIHLLLFFFFRSRCVLFPRPNG